MGGGGSRARPLQADSAKTSVPLAGDVPRDAARQEPLQISTTPRRESFEECEEMRECVAETPTTSEACRAYPCFCPLCMCWYKAALITRCCAHHICLPCWDDYELASKQAGKQLLLCPHCQQGDVQLGSVDQSSGDVRNYLTTPMSQRPQSIAQEVSPIRIGDSTESLIRKLIPFKKTEPSQFNADSFVSNTIEQAVSRIIARSSLT